jgi:hypothetical protein
MMKVYDLEKKNKKSKRGKAIEALNNDFLGTQQR